MWARVSTTQVDSSQVDRLIDSFKETPDLEGMEGAWMLFDRERGQLMLMTLWESEAALKESAEAANQIREEVSEESELTTEWEVHAYEVVLHQP